MTLRNILFAITFIIALTGAVFIAHIHPDRQVPLEKQILGSEISTTKNKPVVGSTSDYRKENFSKHLSLTSSNIVWFTNYYRTEQGLKSLKINTELVQSSTAKAADMFTNQYFDHVRPGPEKISFDRFIDGQKYSFVKIGENLAMGDFSTSYEVVKAWMNSPSHKQNILDPQYTEIGVSIQYGSMNGQEVGIMVQHFGNPRKSCPSLDERMQQEIQTLRVKASDVQKEISLKQPLVISTESTITDPTYELTVKEYNKLVESYNNLVKQVGSLVEIYNKQVKEIDDCIKK